MNDQDIITARLKYTGQNQTDCTCTKEITYKVDYIYSGASNTMRGVSESDLFETLKWLKSRNPFRPRFLVLKDNNGGHITYIDRRRINAINYIKQG